MIKNYEKFIKYRSVWMGVAICWVILFHFGYLELPILNYISSLGYGGVDIFFFASGIGCCYSLLNNGNAWTFFKKRIKRIYPLYLPIVFLFLVIQCVFGEHLSIEVVLGNIFCIGDFLGIRNQFNWYLGAQLIFYLLFPYLVGFVVENKDSKNKLLFMFVVLIFISVLLRGGYYIYMSSRLPTAYLGIVSVILFKDTNEVKNKLLLFIALSFVVGTSILLSSYIYFPEGLIIYGLNWYPFILMTPFMCYVISSIAEKFKIFRKLFDYIGKMSLELYLTHIMLFELISKLKERYEFLDGYKYQLRLLAILVSFAISIIILKIKKRRNAQ